MIFLVYLSDYIIPLLFFAIILIGLFRKVEVYNSFIEGARDGFSVVVGIAPTLIGLMVAVGILRASGALEAVAGFLSPITGLLHFPSELVSLAFVKVFSSSAATGLLLDVFKESGPDSYVGTLASIMMSCTETVFYTMSVYFMAAKVTKSRYTLPGALLATLVGMAASVVLAGMLV